MTIFCSSLRPTKNVCLLVFLTLFFVNIVKISAQQTSPKDTLTTQLLTKSIQLPPPSVLESRYTYDPIADRYIYTVKLGEFDVNLPLVLTPKQYQDLVRKAQIKSYFDEKTASYEGGSKDSSSQKNLLPQYYVKSNLFKTIFGSNTIDIVPQGSIALNLGVRYQKNDNPALSPRNRRNFSFDFDQQISVGINGKIGDRLGVSANYDTESTFDFQNLIKLEFNPPSAKELVGDKARSKIEEIEKRAKGVLDPITSTIEKGEKIIQKGENVIQKGKDAIGSLSEPSFSGNEDAIIQKIEVGNVSMPLNSSLITGAQSLFGFKTELQFGKTRVTGVFSEQRSQSSSVVASGDGTLEEFSIFALDYEEDKHFFLSQFFRDQYNKALSTYPYLNTQVQISRVEVWVTNRGSQTNNVRNIVALQDIGEASPDRTRLDDAYPSFFSTTNPNAYPDNEVNKLDPNAIGSGGVLTDAIRDIATVNQGFGPLIGSANQGFDYAVLESARKLEPNEYQLHPQLGYISLNQKLSNDEVLAVAFQYTLGGKVYQVGEFANDGVAATDVTISEGTATQVSNNSLLLKLLKSNITDVSQPTWDLMMKNIYSTGAFRLTEEDFKLNILYTDPSPINYISPVDKSSWPEGLDKQILLGVFNVDKLNIYNDSQNGGDGFFDFVPGITIDSEYGRIIFTSVEPFGEFLFDKLKNPQGSSGEDYDNSVTYNDNQSKYVFGEMYALTKAEAFDEVEKNKFVLKGRYKSSTGGGGISLGAFNVPRGSVRVTAGGRLLQEGVDYTVNYQVGTVKILDEGLRNSNIPIEVSTESNSFFGQQNKRFSGVNVEHQFNDNFLLGATVMNLSERPISQKANYGSEPVNNTMFGFNGNFSTEAPFLTRWVNKLPNIDTDVPSNVSVRGEIAYLLAGSPKNADFEGVATTYIDDFEGSQSTIDVKGALSWSLSSVPAAGVNGANAAVDDLSSGYNRAKLAWYNIDPIFYTSQSPSEIGNNEISKNETRRIFIDEIFPQQDLVQGQTTIQNTLDLAFYPNELGPYNNASESAFTSTPEENWAGIMRPITSTNFEQSNVEFIEFWMLDTFQNSRTLGDDIGTLAIHLGNISEDILKDGRKQYENGLPGVDGTSLTTSSSWGVTPSSQSLVYAFDAETANRTLQDVGLDGLPDSEESSLYTNGPSNDPARDNYQYFLNASGGILDRYKNYNGLEGNSPVAVSDTNRGSTTIPDTEDINRDNTMNTIDSYFEYRIPIQRNMTPDNHPFVSDVREDVTVDLPNGETIKSRWIQFKIPINKDYYLGTSFNSYFDAINGINDLRTIRFMRLMVKDFTVPTVMRFATLNLVRGDWRRYTKPLNNTNFTYPNTTVDISTVSILENENRVPINYVLPPGVVREQFNNSNTVIRQNEQALSFTVCDLSPKDSRGVFKNVDVNLLQYKKLKMFLHAESLPSQQPLPGEGASEDFDRRMVGFVRLGTDLSENYYQIEVPLKPTSFNPGSSSRLSAEEVWQPESNSIDIPLDLLTKIKAAGIANGSLLEATYYDEELNIIDEFASISSLPGDKKYKFAVKGNPSLGRILTIMIGVKNPSANPGDLLCGEVWFNELRLSEIESKGGWATIGSMDANIADFATVSATGKISTVGFGGIEQNPNQRSQEDYRQYGLATSVNIGQLLPKKWGIQVPMSYSISEEFITPEYDPFYQDIRLQDRLNNAVRDTQKDSIKNQAISYTRHKSINFIGVRKNRSPEQKKRVYDIENFDFSYAFNEENHHDYEIEDLTRQTVKVGTGYQYSFTPFSIDPLKKVPFISQKKYLKWLSEFNFNPIPDNISLATSINRAFSSQRFREVYLEGTNAANQLPLPELQQRNFMFDWAFTLNHNLTRSLRMNFTASNNRIVKNYFTQDAQGNEILNRDLDIWDGFWDAGEPNRHAQSIGLTYNIPFRLIPGLSFINGTYNYTGDFNWQRGSNILADVEDADGNRLGIVNTIQNANTHTLNTTFNLDRLYRSLKWVKKTKGSNKNSPQVKALNTLIGFTTGLKRLQVNYSENNGKVLPGYTESLGFFGTLRPSFGFVFGSQSDIRYEAAKRGWLTEFPEFNQQFTQVHNSKLTFSAEIDWIKDLNIDLNADRNFSENFAENFQVTNGEYQSLTPNSYGNFGISTILIKTAFSKSNETQSKTFSALQDNRLIIARRLADQKGVSTTDIDQDGYPKGFGKNNQAVLIPAFLSAYSGADANNISLEALRDTPLPNWSIQYTGLMRIKSFKKIFKRLSFSHGYRSSYTLNSFQSNLEFDANNPNKLDQSDNFLNETLYTNVNLVEQFNPLLKVDLELKNSISMLAELKKDRALSLSLDNNLLTETFGNELVVGLGYRIKDVKLRTNISGKRKTLKGDINIKADLSVRDNITIIRNLDLLNNQVTAGQTLWSLKVTADYALSRNLTALFFYDHLFSKFAISTAFPQTTIRSGFTIRYNFGQ